MSRIKIKFVILIVSVLFCTAGVSGQAENFAYDKIPIQAQETEPEKIIEEAVKNSRLIFVAKVRSITVVRTGTFFTGKHGEKVYDWTFSNRMVIEKNLKGTAKKSIVLKDNSYKFKRGNSYLIFANPENHLIKAVDLSVSTKELAIVKRILSN